jgi:hypothetical protein
MPTEYDNLDDNVQASQAALDLDEIGDVSVDLIGRPVDPPIPAPAMSPTPGLIPRRARRLKGMFR